MGAFSLNYKGWLLTGITRKANNKLLNAFVQALKVCLTWPRGWLETGAKRGLYDLLVSASGKYCFEG